MVKKSISSLELAAVVQELQFIVGGKISQIYHQEAKEMLFQLHAPRAGKVLLKILPGKWMCMTTVKETPLKPSGFCMQLRKYLDHAIIGSFYQKDAERIVVMELEKKERYSIVIELFSKGNLVLLDAAGKILGVLEQQVWKDRVVKPGEKYIFPAPGLNWKKITEKELGSVLEKSEKKNLAVTLATELGLGGLYAEEICKRQGIDKEMMPREAVKEARKILKGIHDLIKLVEKPQGFVYAEQVTPFPLLEQKELQQTATYGEALDLINPFEIKSPYEKKIAALQNTIAGQEEALQKHEEAIRLNTAKAEAVYQHYQPLQKLLQIVKELRKTKEWGEVAAELKKEKKIKAVDLKNKKIVIQL